MLRTPRQQGPLPRMRHANPVAVFFQKRKKGHHSIRAMTWGILVMSDVPFIAFSVPFIASAFAFTEDSRTAKAQRRQGIRKVEATSSSLHPGWDGNDDRTKHEATRGRFHFSLAHSLASLRLGGSILSSKRQNPVENVNKCSADDFASDRIG